MNPIANNLNPGGWLRRRGWELALWVLAPLVVTLLFPGYFVLASQIAAVGLFALSLDLLIGYAGLLSLGHAAFFGVGAYTAGILSVQGWGEPITGLLAGGVCAGVLGFATSFLVVRVRHLAQLMVTLGIGLMVFEAANRMRSVTGGDDGLQGMDVWPVFGVFDFDFWGRTAFWYAYAVLLVCFIVITRIVDSPFGLALRGLRENPARMAAIGTPVAARLRKAYTLSALFAGIAGATLAQTTQFVALETLSFHLSADVLIMLVLGGVGYRYGGLLGAAVFIVARDVFSGISPEFWQFGLGAVMVLVVLFAPGGVLGGVAWLGRRLGVRAGEAGRGVFPPGRGRRINDRRLPQ
ncbi:branched-chain amino acid ABC transporter permease [Verticiella sediminum]|uniref:Branched-chain amino acid ABC transporter permease n=1 Tax=Verticiella sediminum TaxID=1247510 RepID=A0A556AFV3_9BURK|nr:branched-chain amino acid ABC transporter permease [Verticiella sediminum]TSH91771.1 branched-chain amino acid ABC transporter permease [Verticiella sediminum]